MLLPKFTEGLEAVLFIALNSASEPVSSKQICGYQEVLSRHLEPVLQTLVKEGILKGTKGPKGGYTLAKERRKISVEEIFLLFSREQMVKHQEKLTKCNQIRKDIIKKINSEIEKSISSSLGNLTIEDLCNQFEEKTKTSKPDFSI